MKKVHYRRVRGYRRNPGIHGRPVYYMPRTEKEVRERRVLFGLIGGLVSMLGGVALWMATL